MRNNIFRSLTFLLVLSLIVSCGKVKDDTTPPLVSPPDKAMLTFPDQDAICITGVSKSDTTSSVTFKWVAATNADSYVLHLKNLLTGEQSTNPATGTTLAVTIKSNTPYTWYVVSKSNETTDTAQSDSWKFYNSGPSIISHVPFPADAVSPAFGAQVSAAGGSIVLNWKGSDVDNDIIGFDVYFGTTKTPDIYKTGITAASVSNVPVTAGKTYYWKVVSKDALGNLSNSDLFQFEVN